MQSNKNFGQLTFGFDIGIASVGWAVLNERRIVDLGVRAFDKAETAKEGDSLNLVRRSARLLRRRLHQRAWRLKKLARLLQHQGVIDDIALFKPESPYAYSLWKLRVDGLNRLLTSEEWARVIYHLCKHRGFHWVSKAEEKKAEEDTKGESGQVKKALAATAKLMKEKGYRTAAEMVLAEFPDAQRNKQGDYCKSLSRILLSEEFKLLFDKQCAFKSLHTSTALQEALLGNGNHKTGLFWQQKPALAGADLLKMLGHCTFEKYEYRSAKASFTAERHVWLTKLNNCRIVLDGITRPLNEQERTLALPMPYAQASELSYKQLKGALVKAGLLHDTFRFIGLAYPSKNQIESGNAKDPETTTLVKVPAFQEMRLVLKKAGLETEWESMAAVALDGKPELLDQIATVLSVYKEDDKVEAELGKLKLQNQAKMVEALSGIRFDKFSNLSLKALYKVLPYMELGLRYDEACERAGYHHSQLFKLGDDTQKLLPAFYKGRDNKGRLIFNEAFDAPRNPVVLRALNQARKVMNALINKYGSPHQVNIEMARDLSRPMDERTKIKKAQEEFRERNEKDRTSFNLEYNSTGTLKGKEFEKYQLYREQQGKCLYSLEPFELNRLFEMGYAEIDHALPFSRSFDESKNNKVLVFAKENRDKGNRTPYEYLGGGESSERWYRYVAFVETNKTYRQAKRSRLLKKDFDAKEAEGFRERNLNDTRYICRFFKNYVERYLQLAETRESKRCVVISGQMTAFLRVRWGLTKVRTDSDRHHALDAVVVAACNHSMVQRLSNYSRRKELEKVREGFVDVETGEVIKAAMFDQLSAHFPNPWERFRHELEARLKTDDVQLLQTELEKLGTYTADDLVTAKPLFVSRAPQRRNGGEAHGGTIYGKPKAGHVLFIEDKEATKTLSNKANKVTRIATSKEKATMAIQAISVTGKDTKGNYKFTLEKLESLIDPIRNKRMKDALQVWLENRDIRDARIKEIESSLGKANSKRALTDEEAKELVLLQGYPRKPLISDPKNGPFTGPPIIKVKINIGKTSGIPIRQGLASNGSDSMLRIDVFAKNKKFHVIPIYVNHFALKELPNLAIVAAKDESEWTLIDHSFEFCFSIYPNDFIKVMLKDETHQGYYAGCDRATGAINIWAHDRNKSIGKDGLIRSIGVKTALALEKFNVDVLGNIYPASKEDRRGLA